MRIFITGGSGCIGHYIADLLIKETNHELFFLVRNPSKIKFNYHYRQGIHIIQGDLINILDYKELLQTIHVAILTAACWGGEKESYQVNVEANINLIQCLNPQIVQRIIYFSTASILDHDNQLLPEAGTIGTDYIKSKYQCFLKLQQLELYPKIITVCPTLVFGGDKDKPYSHLSAGLKNLPKWFNLIRWFKADGSFHIIHGYDIATIIAYLVENGDKLDPQFERKLVLGNPPLTINQAIREIGDYLGKKIYFQFPFPPWLAKIFIKAFRIKMAPWDYFCFNYRHFTYKKYVNPSTFNLEYKVPTLSKLLKISGI